MLGCNGCWAHGLQHNWPRHHLHQCCTPPRWHRFSGSHHLAGLPPHISRRCSRQESPLGGESLLSPSLTQLPPLVVKHQRPWEAEDQRTGRWWPIGQLPQGGTRGNTKCSQNYWLWNYFTSMGRSCEEVAPQPCETGGEVP